MDLVSDLKYVLVIGATNHVFSPMLHIDDQAKSGAQPSIEIELSQKIVKSIDTFCLNYNTRNKLWIIANNNDPRTIKTNDIQSVLLNLVSTESFKFVLKTLDRIYKEKPYYQTYNLDDIVHTTVLNLSKQLVNPSFHQRSRLESVYTKANFVFVDTFSMNKFDTNSHEHVTLDIVNEQLKNFTNLREKIDVATFDHSVISKLNLSMSSSTFAGNMNFILKICLRKDKKGVLRIPCPSFENVVNIESKLSYELSYDVLVFMYTCLETYAKTINDDLLPLQSLLDQEHPNWRENAQLSVIEALKTYLKKMSINDSYKKRFSMFNLLTQFKGSISQPWFLNMDFNRDGCKTYAICVTNVPYNNNEMNESTIMNIKGFYALLDLLQKKQYILAPPSSMHKLANVCCTDFDDNFTMHFEMVRLFERRISRPNYNRLSQAKKIFQPASLLLQTDLQHRGSDQVVMVIGATNDTYSSMFRSKKDHDQETFDLLLFPIRNILWEIAIDNKINNTTKTNLIGEQILSFLVDSGQFLDSEESLKELLKSFITTYANSLFTMQTHQRRRLEIAYPNKSFLFVDSLPMNRQYTDYKFHLTLDICKDIFETKIQEKLTDNELSINDFKVDYVTFDYSVIVHIRLGFSHITNHVNDSSIDPTFVKNMAYIRDNLLKPNGTIVIPCPPYTHKYLHGEKVVSYIFSKDIAYFLLQSFQHYRYVFKKVHDLQTILTQSLQNQENIENKKNNENENGTHRFSFGQMFEHYMPMHKWFYTIKFNIDGCKRYSLCLTNRNVSESHDENDKLIEIKAVYALMGLLSQPTDVSFELSNFLQEYTHSIEKEPLNSQIIHFISDSLSHHFTKKFNSIDVSKLGLQSNALSSRLHGGSRKLPTTQRLVSLRASLHTNTTTKPRRKPFYYRQTNLISK